MKIVTACFQAELSSCGGKLEKENLKDTLKRKKETNRKSMSFVKYNWSTFLVLVLKTSTNNERLFKHY